MPCADGVTGNPKSRNVGESSDTESADVGHRREEARMTETPTKTKSKEGMVRAMALPKAINFKALLPGGNKNKDKVSQVESQEPAFNTPQEEEAKPLQTKAEPQEQGLVYAELALRPNQEQPPRVPSDRTEYAEIVYKQPVENKLEIKDDK